MKNIGIEKEREFKEKNPARASALDEQYRAQVDKDNLEWIETAIELEGRRLVKPELNPDSNISAVMIVKNEEKTIKNSIYSIMPHVSEVIVVDTGSVDNTPHFVRSLMDRRGVSLYEKKFIPWHFAKAKNHAISKATGEFIYVIDADEELYSFPKDFRPEGKTLYWIPIENLPGHAVATAPRLFPNDPDFHYRSAVHNILVDPKGTEHKPVEGSNMLHWMEQNTNKGQRRSRRNTKFMLEIRQKPLKRFEDYNNYCKLAVYNGFWDRLMPMWKKGYVLFKRLSKMQKESFHQFLLFPAFMAVSQRMFDIKEWPLEEHIEIKGATIDNMFLQFAKNYCYGNFDSAKACAEKCLELCGKGVTQPKQISIAIQWKRDIQYKYNVMEYF